MRHGRRHAACVPCRAGQPLALRDKALGSQRGVLAHSTLLRARPRLRVALIFFIAPFALVSSSPRSGRLWPLTGTSLPSTQSSPFGPRQLAAENLRYDFHRGIDTPTPIGTPMYAVDDGTVHRAGRYAGYADQIIQVTRNISDDHHHAIHCPTRRSASSSLHDRSRGPRSLLPTPSSLAPLRRSHTRVGIQATRASSTTLRTST